MSLIDGQPDRKSYASARKAAITSTGISRKVTAKEDTVQEVTAQDTMETEISEVLELDGYKMIIKEREQTNRRYRVSYDAHSRTIIICFPTHVHERAGEMIISSMVNEVIRMLQNAGVGDDITSRIQSGGNVTIVGDFRGRSYKEPDGLIIFEDRESKNVNRIALKSDSLRHIPVSRGFCRCASSVSDHRGPGCADIRYIDAFNTQQRHERRPFGPLVYNGHIWFGTLRNAFFETYRGTHAGVVKSEQAYLVKDGVDVSEAIPRDLSTIDVRDFVPDNWLSDDVLRSSAVNFLRPQIFMGMLSDAIFRTALNRVSDTFVLEETS
ncbi:hypothetical protein V1525DRAFT_387833 [Lipomyces kononenkoae]|uniref:Uncharacterized protein n=1 Tax=Lipomyces kononenkoae TaxID=34357 RepID=A0ACC3T2K8_LIPKO